MYFTLFPESRGESQQPGQIMPIPAIPMGPLTKAPNNNEIDRYLSLVNCYMADEDLKVHLKPWLHKHSNDGDPRGLEDQLRPITLYALYKCMAENCIYSTNDATKMLAHMADHEKLVKYYMRMNGTKELSRRKKCGWLECAYCSHIADLNSLLVQHIEREHSSSPFQCSHCFYRTIEIANMDSHIVQHHALEEKISILLCNAKPKIVNAERTELLRSRAKYVPPFVCNHGN